MIFFLTFHKMRFCSFELFLRWALFLKIFLIVFLLVLVFMNLMNQPTRNEIMSFPEKHVKLFIYENLVIGITAGISTWVICYFRNKDVSAQFIYFLLTFLLLVILHCLFQFSGLYNLSYHKTKETFIMPRSTIIISICLLVLFIIATGITAYLSWCSFNKKNWSSFQIEYFIPQRITECIVFAFAYTLPSLWIAYNRNKALYKQDIYYTIVTLVSFVLLYVLLEVTGIFSSLGLPIFQKKIKNI